MCNYSFSTFKHVNVHPESLGPTLKLFLKFTCLFGCFVMYVSQRDPWMVAPSADACANFPFSVLAFSYAHQNSNMAFLLGDQHVVPICKPLLDWSLSRNAWNSVDCTYVDFSKAFDSVVYYKLCCQLSSFGFHSTPPLGRSPLEYCHNVWYGKRVVRVPMMKKI